MSFPTMSALGDPFIMDSGQQLVPPQTDLHPRRGSSGQLSSVHSSYASLPVNLVRRPVDDTLGSVQVPDLDSWQVVPVRRRSAASSASGRRLSSADTVVEVPPPGMMLLPRPADVGGIPLLRPPPTDYAPPSTGLMLVESERFLAMGTPACRQGMRSSERLPPSDRHFGQPLDGAGVGFATEERLASLSGPVRTAQFLPTSGLLPQSGGVATEERIGSLSRPVPTAQFLPASGSLPGSAAFSEQMGSEPGACPMPTFASAAFSDQQSGGSAWAGFVGSRSDFSDRQSVGGGSAWAGFVGSRTDLSDRQSAGGGSVWEGFVGPCTDGSDQQSRGGSVWEAFVGPRTASEGSWRAGRVGSCSSASDGASRLHGSWQAGHLGVSSVRSEDHQSEHAHARVTSSASFAPCGQHFSQPVPSNTASMSPRGMASAASSMTFGQVSSPAELSRDHAATFGQAPSSPEPARERARLGTSDLMDEGYSFSSQPLPPPAPSIADASPYLSRQAVEADYIPSDLLPEEASEHAAAALPLSEAASGRVPHWGPPSEDGIAANDVAGPAHSGHGVVPTSGALPASAVLSVEDMYLKSVGIDPAAKRKQELMEQIQAYDEEIAGLLPQVHGLRRRRLAAHEDLMQRLQALEGRMTGG